MIAEIVEIDVDHVVIEWQDETIGFGVLSMKYATLGCFVLDSQFVSIETVIKIFKAINDNEKVHT